MVICFNVLLMTSALYRKSENLSASKLIRATDLPGQIIRAKLAMHELGGSDNVLDSDRVTHTLAKEKEEIKSFGIFSLFALI